MPRSQQLTMSSDCVLAIGCPKLCNDGKLSSWLYSDDVVDAILYELSEDTDLDRLAGDICWLGILLDDGEFDEDGEKDSPVKYAKIILLVVALLFR